VRNQNCVGELEADRHVAMHALRSPFPMDVDYVLEPIEGGRATCATIRIRGNARGMYGLPGPLLGWFVDRWPGTCGAPEADRRERPA
jgi:hypothetical protein